MVTDDVFAVIAEATRRDILVSLRKGDKAVGELVQELAASQPTISKHLKVLREADLVSMRAQGQKRYYTLNPKPLAGIASWLETFDVAAAPAPEPARTAGPRILPVPAPDTLAAAAAAPAAAAEAPQATPPAAALQPAAALAGRPAGSPLSPAVVLPVGTAGEDRMPQQIGRTVGRAATRAADLLASLPKFGRRK
ncbi:DNA-binding transcriptional ArsR family regulator [Arthrobacter ginsengisoli]|uniref:DNA-binding transcriptional ArsR family regulator n=1 Tax=Arthrobacter ginsengisoli TaxID=1356565 RepID=A0ABU1UBW8_9MICC|nr:metalloregulator ArsR/SmtB family transcription factor [Arthrobacter ginsengisoli]MDR7082628.1 DNA-binding transcriptional ArsR family regulator [Arthrobacter ginsengisoli]